MTLLFDQGHHAYFPIARNHRGNTEKQNDLTNYIRNRDWSPVLAGLFASATYILVLFAMNFVTNVSYVQVFRQLGLPIGMALGIIILKEKCTATKLAGIVLILAGLVLTIL